MKLFVVMPTIAFHCFPWMFGEVLDGTDAMWLQAAPSVLLSHPPIPLCFAWASVPGSIVAARAEGLAAAAPARCLQGAPGQQCTAASKRAELLAGSGGVGWHLQL